MVMLNNPAPVRSGTPLLRVIYRDSKSAHKNIRWEQQIKTLARYIFLSRFIR